MKSETSVWDHYIDYLEEATQRDIEIIKKSCDKMKSCIADGCKLEALKKMMLAEFEPITIMQALEQWQNQMDLMLYTGLNRNPVRNPLLL